MGKRDYMVIRGVRAKARNNSGGRPKKVVKVKHDKSSDSADDLYGDSNDFSKRNKAPLQPLKIKQDRDFGLNQHRMTPQQQQHYQQQQLIMSQFRMSQNNHNNSTDQQRANINFDFSL